MDVHLSGLDLQYRCAESPLIGNGLLNLPHRPSNPSSSGGLTTSQSDFGAMPLVEPIDFDSLPHPIPPKEKWVCQIYQKDPNIQEKKRAWKELHGMRGGPQHGDIMARLSLALLQCKYRVEGSWCTQKRCRFYPCNTENRSHWPNRCWYDAACNGIGIAQMTD
jgi:hypothetical protein